MPRHNDKPGPKSSKRYLKENVKENLGDTSESVEDDTPRISNRFEQMRTSEFQTPTRDYDATDYGLEFTSSHLNISPRRCSTVRPESRRAITQHEPQEQPTTTKRATTTTTTARRKQINPTRKETRFLKEVHRLANTPHFLIPRLPFSRLVRELLHQRTLEITHMSRDALEALQTSAEMYLTQRMQDAYLLTLHRGRVTLSVQDLKLINFLFASM